ncbi:peroxyureidoacrylate/ureidoacrylate amidohydrolase RutB [Paraliobacillus ryukyuensis]|uniref:Nicotinamidase-related amidase n=1 Tax=Paraliobacillus ryukyuensis TaxID=200904 RepID=A0A366EE14_9BACI|nr:cysteine hydrolase family protein [Paraliobacillus ryukyuensis]RBP00266.1 nicotinamidase-related amidase [Paraliobacillus ryukyuensis]
MRKYALLVVDVQTGLVNDELYNKEMVIQNIKMLIATARKSSIEVIYVRHDDGEGETLAHGTDQWKIYHEITPNVDEKIVDKKYNSAFFKTDLKSCLDKKHIDTLIVTGMQTEYCMDATVKSAFDSEYEVIIPEQTNSSADNAFLSGKNLYAFYNFSIWHNRFAKVVPLDDVTRLIKESKKEI